VRYCTTDHEERTATTGPPVAGIWHGEHSGNQAADVWLVTAAKSTAASV
jgi:hypothetical protein